MIHDDTAADLLRPGQLIAARYELESFLGKGGFASVFLAKDRQLGRPVAVKFLDLERISMQDTRVTGTMLQRFEREARLAAAIRHPNVVQIYDIGSIGGDELRPFIVMEALEGHDLKEHVGERGPLDPSDLLPKFVACLDGLGRAHEKGIVHKDLKPSNLFVHDLGRRTESLRIVDFGIAHIANPQQTGDAVERLTATGQILGTPQYLPPEYINGQEVTPALDVYQMALILAEILSGEHVVDSDVSLQCLLIHGDGRLELPSYLLDSPLGDVLRRGLALDPKDRYPDANALADALGAMDPSSIPASPKVPGQPLARRRLWDTANPGAPEHTVPGIDAAIAPATPSAGGSGGRSTMAVLLAVAGALMLGVMVLVAALMFLIVDPADPVDAEFTELTDVTEIVPGDAPEPPSLGAEDVELLPAQPPVLGAPGDEIAEEVEDEVDAIVDEITNEIAEDDPEAAGLIRAARSARRANAQRPSARPRAPKSAPEPPEPPQPEERPSPEPGEERGFVAADAVTVRQLIEDAEQALSRNRHDEAIELCQEAIELGGGGFPVISCYNIIMRASWSPVRPFGERERRGCVMLADYAKEYTQVSTSIMIQRKIMKCVENGY